MRGFLSTHPIQDLVLAPFYADLVEGTRRALSDVAVSSAVTTLMRAVLEPGSEREDEEPEMSDEDDEAELAREFNEGAGKPPTREEARRLRDGAAARKAHKISLVG